MIRVSSANYRSFRAEIVKTQSRLTYFGFDIDFKDLDGIMDGIIAALTFVHNVYRKELKIGFNVITCVL